MTTCFAEKGSNLSRGIAVTGINAIITTRVCKVNEMKNSSIKFSAREMIFGKKKTKNLKQLT